MRSYITAPKLIIIGLMLMVVGYYFIPRELILKNIFYLFVILPTLFILLHRPSREMHIGSLFRDSKIILILGALLLFPAIWGGVWDSSGEAWHIIRRCLSVSFLLLAFCSTRQYSAKILEYAPVTIAMLGALASVVSIIYFYGLEDAYRLALLGAANSNENQSGNIIGLSSIFLMMLILKPKQALGLRFFFLGLLFATLAALFLTNSRGNMLALIIVFGLIILRYSPRPKLIFSVSTIIAGGIVYVAYTTGVIGTVLERGFSYRPEIWAAAFEDIRQNPFFGIGMQYPAEVFVASENRMFAHEHSIIIALLRQGGMFAFVCYATLAFFTIKKALSFKDVDTSSWGFIYIYGILCFLTESGYPVDKYDTPWLISWVPLAIIMIWIRDSDPKEEVRRA